jgi:hypothetical protein
MQLDAYDHARLTGFKGTAEEFYFSEYLKSGFDAARSKGYKGSESALEKAALTAEKKWAAWANIIKGADGLGVYELAVKKGFEGTEAEFLQSLRGQNAYELAKEKGFVGSLAEFLESLHGKNVTPEDVAAAVDAWFARYPDKALPPDEQVQAAVDLYLSENPPPTGKTPDHQIDGTRIRFEQSDGTWGEWIELKTIQDTRNSTGGGPLKLIRYIDGLSNFPPTGNPQMIYVDISTDPRGAFVWDNSGREYIQIGGSASIYAPLFNDATVVTDLEAQEDWEASI